MIVHYFRKINYFGDISYEPLCGNPTFIGEDKFAKLSNTNKTTCKSCLKIVNKEKK